MKIAITSIQRNRNKYITEWIAFHLAVGFNQFYIYCHKTDDGMQKKLLEISKNYPVEIFYMEMDDFSQSIAYQHAWKNFGDKVGWMAFIDGDEFLFPTQSSSMEEALRPYQDIELSAIAVFWKCYGSNGHEADPDGLIIENYPRHSSNDFLPNRHVKSILKGGEFAVVSRPHAFLTNNGTFDENMRIIKSGWPRDYEPTYNAFQINHYVLQSKEFFFQIKRKMSGADHALGWFTREADEFQKYDRNEEDDGLSKKFIEPTKIKMLEIQESIERCFFVNSPRPEFNMNEVIEIAEFHEASGDIKKAVSIYENWLSEYDDYEIIANWPIHFNLALLLQKSGNLLEAKKQILFALEKNPSNPLAEKLKILIDSQLSKNQPAEILMKQTPAHNIVNTDLLQMIPANTRRIVEVGCMHGAMAQAYREINPNIHYVGIDIDPDYAQVAAKFCDRTLGADIELMSAPAFQDLFPSDCWIFGDCLEHLRDPWRIVRMVRESIDPDGCMLVCIPNAQHWSVQMRLATGQFRYEDSGLLDRTHLRWFTRVTLIEMFVEAGWQIEAGFSRQIPTQAPQALLDGIRAIAEAAGANGEEAVADAQAFQYLFRLRPA